MDVDIFLKGSGALTIDAVKKKVKASCITLASAKVYTCMMMPMKAMFMQDNMLDDHHEMPRRACSRIAYRHVESIAAY